MQLGSHLVTPLRNRASGQRRSAKKRRLPNDHVRSEFDEMKTRLELIAARYQSARMMAARRDCLGAT
jgi:hypothetical protein